MKITPSQGPLHATVTGLDLAEPLSSAEHKALELALAERGVLSFPGQQLNPQQFRRFSARFGGVSHAVSVPVAAVLAIYARVNGQGMALPPESDDAEAATGMPMDVENDGPTLELVQDGSEPDPAGVGLPVGHRVSSGQSTTTSLCSRAGVPSTLTLDARRPFPRA